MGFHGISWDLIRYKSDIMLLAWIIFHGNHGISSNDGIPWDVPWDSTHRNGAIYNWVNLICSPEASRSLVHHGLFMGNQPLFNILAIQISEILSFTVFTQINGDMMGFPAMIKKVCLYSHRRGMAIFFSLTGVSIYPC